MADPWWRWRLQLIASPQLAVVNPDRVRLFDIVKLPAAAGQGSGVERLPTAGRSRPAGDLNGDGLTDLLVANGLTLAIWGKGRIRLLLSRHYLAAAGGGCAVSGKPDLKLVQAIAQGWGQGSSTDRGCGSVGGD